MPHKYRSKPATVEAVVVRLTNREAVATWCGGRIGWVESVLNRGVFVPTNNGEAFAAFGHYVVKGVSDFYPCDPVTFDARWELDE